MAVPRPMLLALIAALLLVATFQVMVSARNRAADPPPAVAAEAAPKSAPSKARPDRGSPGKAVARNREGPKTGSARERRKAAERPEPGRPSRSRSDAGASVGLPGDVARALARRQVLVLFFFEPGGADDEATARAVESLRGDRGVAVFSEPIRRLARYHRVVGDAQVSQAPATVIVGRDLRARVVEGFVDEQTLAQAVADAR